VSGKKIYLEDHAQFTIVHGAAVTIRKGETYQATIDWGSTIDLAGGKTDPDSKDGTLIGEFTHWVGDQSLVLPVYLEEGFVPGQMLFYYYEPAAHKTPATHKTYLKEGTMVEVQWKQGQVVKVKRPSKLDFDRELTLTAKNLLRAEVGNDGPVKGTFVKDGVTYNVYLEHLDDGYSSYYCYLN
jgi:hypothetical protein